MRRERGQRPRAAAARRGLAPGRGARRRRPRSTRRTRSSRPFSRREHRQRPLAGRRGDSRARRRARWARRARRARRDHLGLDQPGRPAASRARRAPATCPPTCRSRDQPGGTDEGRAMAEIVYDEAPGISGIAFASGTTGSAAKAATSTISWPAGAKVIADDIAWFDRAVLPGRDHLAGRRPRQGRGRRVLHLRRQRRHAQLGGHLHGGATRGLRPGRRQSTPSRRSARSPRRATADRLCSGPSRGARATPTSQSTSTRSPEARRRSRSPPTPTTSPPGCPKSSRRDRRQRRQRVRSGSPSAASRATGTPFLKFIDFTNGAVTVTSSSPTDSERDRPGRGLGERRAHGRRVALRDADDARDVQLARARHALLRCRTARPLAQPDVRQKPELAAADGVSTSVGGTSRRSSARAPPPRPRPASRR